MNLLDLSGPAFLAVYVGLMLAAYGLGVALRRLCRARHDTAATTPDLAPLEAAYLAGGRERAVDAALIGLLRHDMIAVQPGGGGFVVGNRVPDHVDPLQNELYHQVRARSGAIESLRATRTAALARIETKLGGLGLLLGSGGTEHTCLMLAAGAPMAAVVLLGLAKIGIGLARDKPVILLALLVAVATVALVAKVVKLPLRSARGEAALERLRRRNAALEATGRRRSGDLDEASLVLAVALFGTGVLAADLLWMRQGFVSHRASDGGGSSCGSSSDSSGCGGGGGGCGGCGG